MAAITLAGVCKAYPAAAGPVEVLAGLDLRIDCGEYVAIMGPSGSGKTTLLNLIAGLDTPTRGEVVVGGAAIGTMRNGALSRWRAANIGLVFQFYNLMPTLTALQNVELPLLLTSLPARRRRANAQVALELVGMAERASYRPAQLSGGQQQRVAIARAIVSDPGILVCDEPTGDLDRAAADQVLALLRTLNREHGKTVVMVTHDPKAAATADRIVELEKGRLVASLREEMLVPEHA